LSILPTRQPRRLPAGIFLAVLGRELIPRHDEKVCLTPTFKVVRRLLKARAGLKPETEFKRLDRFDAVIGNNIGHVQQTREEVEVFISFLAERDQRRGVTITSNPAFSNGTRSSSTQ